MRTGIACRTRQLLPSGAPALSGIVGEHRKAPKPLRTRSISAAVRDASQTRGQVPSPAKKNK